MNRKNIKSHFLPKIILCGIVAGADKADPHKAPPVSVP
jgi:hypothetical protein